MHLFCLKLRSVLSEPSLNINITYVIKVTDDDEGKKASFKFVHYGSGGYWNFPKEEDIKTIDVKYVFYGPCEPVEVTRQCKYRFEFDSTAHHIYKCIAKNM